MEKNFWFSVMSALIFGLIGIGMTVLGFKVFDWMTPINMVEQLAEKHNIAVAIVVAAMIIAVGIVVAAVISA
jgi:putative membrane protein